MGEPDDLVARIHNHVEEGEVDKAVFACLRLARAMGDHFSAVIFLRELGLDHKQFSRQFAEQTRGLSREASEFAWRLSGEIWLEEHTMDTAIVLEEPEKNVLAMGVGEMRRDLVEIDKKIADLIIPPGLRALDSAELQSRYGQIRAQLRLRASAVHQILERIRGRCMEYASRIEEQLRASRRNIDFLLSVQNTVHNYFAARHVEAHEKLLKANELLQSAKHEDFALLLTTVRRAMKSIADHFFPPSDTPQACADGKVRVLDEESYLNRLDEFCNRLPRSTSSELTKAELAHLGFFARRINSIASKGVHAEVSMVEAQQGLLGLYLFTYNLISRHQNPS